jgi:site-specific DNA recombinase
MPRAAAPNPKNRRGDRPSTDAPTAVLYLRVSTSEQASRGGEAEGYSLPIQRERAQAKAKELGAVITHECIDAGKSATTMKRAGLQELLEYAVNERPTYVIVYKLDRLARNLLDTLVIRRTLEHADVQLISCSEAFDDSAAGELALNIMGSVNQHYSRNLAEELKSKLVGKVKSGGTIGKAAIGYLNTVERVDGVELHGIAMDEQRASLVLWGFEAFATGEWSLTTITDALQARGLTTVPSRKMAEKPIPRSTVARMLRNPYYTGVLVWKGVPYPGNHQPLVSQATFDAVQAVLDSHNRVGERHRVHNHYLKGSVRCAECGSTLCMTRAVNRHGSEYFYFFCLGNYRRYTDCSQRAVPVDLVEAHVEKKWQAVQFNREYASTIQDLVTEELGKDRNRQERDKARALKRRTLLNDQRLKLMHAHYTDAIPLELLKSEQDRITKEMTETQRQLAAADMSIDLIENLLRRCMDFLTNCYQSYVMATPAVRRQLNQAMFDAFFVSTDGALTAQPTEVFRSLLRTDALRVKAGRGGPKPTSSDPPVHDSREWEDGIPRWIVELTKDKKKGSSSESRPTLPYCGLGLNKTYLAEGVGFEPTEACTSRLFKSRAFVRSAIPPSVCQGSRRPTGVGERRVQVPGSTSARSSSTQWPASRRAVSASSRMAGPAGPAAG